MRKVSIKKWAVRTLAVGVLAVLWGCHPSTDWYYQDEDQDFKNTDSLLPSAPKGQTEDEVKKKSDGCMSCHKNIEFTSAHESSAVKLGCTDCHGGRGEARTKEEAHVHPRGPWYEGGHDGGPHHAEGEESAANPQRSSGAWLMESPEFVRFVNPTDLRVAKFSCGACHTDIVRNVPKSMMSHGGMLWGAALYNNGAHNSKRARYGEAYMIDGKPARVQTIPQPSEEETKTRGVLPFLDPLPRYNITQGGNVLRAFERGGKEKGEIGIPNPDEDNGKPDFKLSTRGFGTELSTDPVFLGIQKTRLFDPTLWFLGTNDNPGDYRSSGCAACHTPYANDRDPVHSSTYSQYGNRGFGFTKDEALKEKASKESGHPIQHVLTTKIPSSQCTVCHIHPGTTVTQTYFGQIWWDNETEGAKMYPKTQVKKTERDLYKIKIRNPEQAAQRGLWSDAEFLATLYDRNAEFKQVQFADHHSHGWINRNIYKTDRKGNLLDKDGNVVPFDSPNKFKKGEKGEPIAGAAVHLMDIHAERGMQCMDCHFKQDAHGNGKLYGEVRNATEIMCIDCHGTIQKYTDLKTSGNARLDENDPNRTNLADLRSASGKKKFEWSTKDGVKVLIQRSGVDPNKEWVVPQTKDGITPGHPRYNEKSRYAKTMRRDGKTWGDVPKDSKELAHQDTRMDCYVCHTAWVASCFGCHLPMKANQARTSLHYENAKSRNWTQYNFQTLRDDIFMLGIDGAVKGNKVVTTRSSCAVIVDSQNALRDNIYSQQQTISAEGFSGQAFAPHYPHAVRTKETRKCTDCHLSEKGDNNAWMAQVLMQGTNLTNFAYRYVYAACDDGGLEAVVVTEREEPQAVIGSTLHRDAFPEEYAEHLKKDRKLEEFREHAGTVKQVQLRGEYVYAARGKGGLTIYDVSTVDQKDFSEHIQTAPFSPLGQRLYVKSKNCTSVISPTTLGVDPTRQPPLRPRNPANLEQGISLTYAFLYCTDAEEGLFTVLAGTLLDGDPTNNFLNRHLTFNPGGVLTGAQGGVCAGNNLWIVSDKGLVCVDISKIGSELVAPAQELFAKHPNEVVDLDKVVRMAPKANPDDLKVLSVVPLNKPKMVRIQFRYAFVVDADGLKVIDITDPAAPRLCEKGTVCFPDARNVYLARTYAYVSAGKDGVAIVDIEKPEEPKLVKTFNAEGHLCDVYDVKVAMTNASAFAYVANGEHGMAVLQLFSPERNPNYLGWSPEPDPVLIATKHTKGRCMNISDPLQRDRAVDESGNQLSVFTRVGARPFNKGEMDTMFKIGGKVFTVSDTPKTTPNEVKVVGPDPKLLAEIAELEEAVKKERNPAKKKEIQAKLDELKKKAAEAPKDPEEEIKDLEEQVKKERNPAKKKELQKKLDELKAGKK